VRIKFAAFVIDKDLRFYEPGGDGFGEGVFRAKGFCDGPFDKLRTGPFDKLRAGGRICKIGIRDGRRYEVPVGGGGCGGFVGGDILGQG
jgi:hypothetical protein